MANGRVSPFLAHPKATTNTVDKSSKNTVDAKKASLEVFK